MASKGKAPARASSARTRDSSSCQQPTLETQLYEIPEHAERAKALEDRKVIHECTIKFSEGKKDTFRERILARGWNVMYEPAIPINLSWVREFYANRSKCNQCDVFMRGRKIPCFLEAIKRVLNILRVGARCGYADIFDAYNREELDMEEVLRLTGKEGATWLENPQIPTIPARPKKKILNKEVWMWMKLIVCNITPTKHETTLSMEIVLLIYALMKNESANVPRYPRDKILKIPKAHQFFPFGKWIGKYEEVAHPISPPMQSPGPPSTARTDIPVSSTFSLPEPS
ncbi:hypothetical protein PIB30_077828 [Stylosanthes scabra]|uniref:Putative plant transposon protein domain-containing protein n=1 Tax=Stylosanthes scabra TaxID=79078 RepID=A0ABU6YR91_9FABA|nr:hypothetical protein [Stylosanthes scabra]